MIGGIIKNPLILSKLINRELPVELFDISKKMGIKIFPNTWKDFDMKCSCPDWAVPCKHIATDNIIANEIDRNPFIVFKLRGLDILNEIIENGFISNSSKTRIPLTESILSEKKPKSQIKIMPSETDTIDFSIIPDLRDNILSLLDDEAQSIKNPNAG